MFDFLKKNEKVTITGAHFLQQVSIMYEDMKSVVNNKKRFKDRTFLFYAGGRDYHCTISYNNKAAKIRNEDMFRTKFAHILITDARSVYDYHNMQELQKEFIIGDTPIHMIEKIVVPASIL